MYDGYLFDIQVEILLREYQYQILEQIEYKASLQNPPNQLIKAKLQKSSQNSHKIVQVDSIRKKQILIEIVITFISQIKRHSARFLFMKTDRLLEISESKFQNISYLSYHKYATCQNNQQKQKQIHCLDREDEMRSGKVRFKKNQGQGNKLILNLLLVRKYQNYMFEDHQPVSIVKTFVFQKQQAQESTFVQRQIVLNSALIDISSLLIMYCPPSLFNVCIYDPFTNKYVDLEKINAQHGVVPSHYLEPSIILIKFKKKDERIKDQNQQSSSDQEVNDKQDIRSRQRTIRQAIALVKRWRQLIKTNKSGKFNKRLNLQQAAREIGVSKKTLDDYYCQLRLAQLHNFNFTYNIDQRIGKLRNFVKEHNKEDTPKMRHNKYAKNLKVIDEFIFDKAMQDYIMFQKQLAENQRMKEQNKSIERSLENPFLNEFAKHKIFQTLEDEFYKGFQFLLDQPTDPFLCDNESIKKNGFQDQHEDYLF